MRTVAKLFGRSPLIPLQVHMEKVEECVNAVEEILKGFVSDMPHEEICERARALSKLEHNADLVKNDIRNSLPRGLFMQVDRGNLMSMLSDQDSIADKAEDIGVILSFKALPLLDPLMVHFNPFLEKNVEAFRVVRTIIAELDELAEMGFGGAEEDGGMDVDEDEEMPEFFKEAKHQPEKTKSKRKKTKVAELVREKIRKVLEVDTELADKRAGKCDENDFLRLLSAFNAEGIHFS